jgi:hypothetical protein
MTLLKSTRFRPVKRAIPSVVFVVTLDAGIGTFLSLWLTDFNHFREEQ